MGIAIMELVPTCSKISAKLGRQTRTLARILRKNWKGFIGGGVVLIAVVGAICAPLIAPEGPNVQNLSKRLLPPAWLPGGDSEFPLGTDALGRSVLTRLLYGGRIALLVGVFAVLLQGGIGIPLGMMAGYFGRGWDMLLMRIADVQLSIPFLVLAIAILGALGASLLNILLVLGLTGWVRYGRIARASTLATRESVFIEAARAIGTSRPRILLLHILPNIAAPLIVVGSQQVAAMILAESALSYLGLSVPPPTPTWGGMVADGRNYLATNWYVSTIPGLVIMTVILGINLLGDWLTDWLNPLIKHR